MRKVTVSAAVAAATLVFTLAVASPGLAHRDSSPSVAATPKNDTKHTWPGDGCSSPFKGFTVSRIPGIFDFYHACMHHDGCYNGYLRNGNKGWYTRLNCDAHFLNDMWKSCLSTALLARPACYKVALDYHGLVRVFAKKAYKGPAGMSS